MKQFATYIGLNMAGMLGLSCYILADTLFVSAKLGANGLAALNLAIAVYSLIQALGLLLGIGGATRCAIHRAHNETQRGRQVFGGTLATGLGVGLVLLLAGCCFTPQIASLLGANPTIHPMTTTYLQVILCFAPCFITNNILLAFVRNDQNPRLSMGAMLLGSFGNIALDWLFIFPLEMGMFGAALATGLAPVMSMGLLALHWLPKKSRKSRLTPCLQRFTIKGVLPLGISAFVTELSSGIVLAVFNLVILDIAGNTGVAAYGVVANLSLVVVALFTGLGQGIQPLISRAWGQKDHGALQKLRRHGLVLALILGCVFCLAGIVFANPFIAFFNSQGDAQLQALAGRGILLYFPGFLFAGVNICSAALFSAQNRPRPAFVISFVRGCGAVLPFIALLPPFLAMDGVWLSFTLAEATACVLSIFLLKKRV